MRLNKFFMRYEDNHKLRDEYTKWLANEEWDYFFTGTFRDGSFTPNSARRAGERFFKPFTSKELVVLFIESGSLYGEVHLHGLLRFDPFQKPTARLIWSRWFEKYGRAKVEVINSREDVAGYCCKYVTKEMKDETFIVITNED